MVNFCHASVYIMYRWLYVEVDIHHCSSHSPFFLFFFYFSLLLYICSWAPFFQILSRTHHKASKLKYKIWIDDGHQLSHSSLNYVVTLACRLTFVEEEILRFFTEYSRRKENARMYAYRQQYREEKKKETKSSVHRKLRPFSFHSVNIQWVVMYWHTDLEQVR